MLLLLGHLSHLRTDLGELVLHLADELLPALRFTGRRRKETNVGMNILHRRGGFTDDDRYVQLADGIDVLTRHPRCHDDEIRMQRRNLLDGRAAGDDRRNPVTYPRDIRMLPIGERFIDRRHALRLHKTEHQLVRSRADR